jgi:hypothetical protein
MVNCKATVVYKKVWGDFWQLCEGMALPLYTVSALVAVLPTLSCNSDYGLA